MKQIAIHFEFPDGTREQYESVWEDLRSSGNDIQKVSFFTLLQKVIMEGYSLPMYGNQKKHLKNSETY